MIHRAPRALGEKRRAVFLDRDGVLNEVIRQGAHYRSPRSLEELVIAPDAVAVVEEFRRAGYLVFVITNQPEIERGTLSHAVLGALNGAISAELNIDDWAMCLHDDAHDCACRKPAPGMLRGLAERWQVALEESWVIGDTWKDVAAGRAAGCRTVLLRRPYSGAADPDLEVMSLREAADLVLVSEAAVEDPA